MSAVCAVRLQIYCSAAAATSGETQGFTTRPCKAVNAYFMGSRAGCLFASVLHTASYLVLARAKKRRNARLKTMVKRFEQLTRLP